MRDATNSEIDQFLAELQSMTRAGLPLPEGLRIHADSLPPGAQRELTAHVAAALAAGRKLSDALDDSPVKVSRSLIAVAKCAELSGNAPEVFSFAVRHSRQIERQRDSLFTAVLYPAIIMMVIPLMILGISVYVTPQFQKIFRQLGADLPSSTRLLFSLSDFQRSPFGIALTLAIVVGIACCITLPVPKDRILRSLLGSFYFRRIAELSDAAMSLQFAGALIQRGAPPSDAFAAAEVAASRNAAQASLRKMSEAAARGQAVSGLLDPSLPPTAAAVIRTGEAQGKLGEACTTASEYCMERFERTGIKLVRIFEPLAILILGLGVMWYVISLYIPLFNIPRLVGRN